MLEDQIFKFNQYTQLISVTVKFIKRNFPYNMIKCAFHMQREIENIYKIADNNNYKNLR